MKRHFPFSGQRLPGALLSLVVLIGFCTLGWILRIAPQSSVINSNTPSTSNALPAPDNPQTFSLPSLAPRKPNGLIPTPSLPGRPGVPGMTIPQLPLPNLQSNPQLAQLWQKAITAQQANRLDEAVAAYREMLRLDPKVVPAHVNLAWVLLRQRKEEKAALWHLRRATAIAPRAVQPRVMLAQALACLKEPKSAFEQWTQIAGLAKNQKQLQPLYIQAAATAGALAFEQLKDLSSAETWLRRANDALHSRDPRTVLMLGRVLTARGKHAQATEVLRTASQQSPKVLELQMALAEAQWVAKDQAGAIGTLRLLEKQVPASQNKGLALAQIKTMLGRAFVSQKQYPEAIDAFQGALLLLPKNSPAIIPTRGLLAETYASQAGDLEKGKKLPEALEVWAQAAALFPSNPRAYLQRGRLLQQLKRENEALREFRRVLQILPNEPNALLQAAQLAEKTGDLSHSSGDWQKLINTQPQFKPAYHGLMRVAAKQHQLAPAMKFLEARAASTPDERAIYDAVLAAGQKEGKLNEARAWVERLAKKYPKVKAPRASLIAFTPKPAKTPAPTSTPAPSPAATPRNTPTAPIVPQSTPQIPLTPRPPTSAPTSPAVSLLPTPQPMVHDEASSEAVTDGM